MCQRTIRKLFSKKKMRWYRMVMLVTWGIFISLFDPAIETFFNTEDNRYIIKSVPRRFEHTFFRDDLLEPYVSYIECHPDSIIVRITDFLG